MYRRLVETKLFYGTMLDRKRRKIIERSLVYFEQSEWFFPLERAKGSALVASWNFGARTNRGFDFA
jgi:hypothetical protein